MNQTLSSYPETLTKPGYEENENLRHIREVIFDIAFLDELKYFLTENAQTQINNNRKGLYEIQSYL